MTIYQPVVFLYCVDLILNGFINQQSSFLRIVSRSLYLYTAGNAW